MVNLKSLPTKNDLLNYNKDISNYYMARLMFVVDQIFHKHHQKYLVLDSKTYNVNDIKDTFSLFTNETKDC